MTRFRTLFFRFFPAFLGALLALSLLGVASLPLLLSTTSGQRWIKEKIALHSGGTIRIDHLHFHWFGAQELRGVHYTNGKIHASAKKAQVHVGPFWFLGPKNHCPLVQLDHCHLNWHPDQERAERTPQDLIATLIAATTIPLSEEIEQKEFLLPLTKSGNLAAHHLTLNAGNQTAQIDSLHLSISPTRNNLFLTIEGENELALRGSNLNGEVALALDEGKLLPKGEAIWNLDGHLHNTPATLIEELASLPQGFLEENLGPFFSLRFLARYRQSDASFKGKLQAKNVLAEVQTTRTANGFIFEHVDIDWRNDSGWSLTATSLPNGTVEWELGQIAKGTLAVQQGRLIGKATLQLPFKDRLIPLQITAIRHLQTPLTKLLVESEEIHFVAEKNGDHAHGQMSIGLEGLRLPNLAWTYEQNRFSIQSPFQLYLNAPTLLPLPQSLWTVKELVVPLNSLRKPHWQAMKIDAEVSWAGGKIPLGEETLEMEPGTLLLFADGTKGPTAEGTVTVQVPGHPLLREQTEISFTLSAKSDLLGVHPLLERLALANSLLQLELSGPLLFGEELSSEAPLWVAGQVNMKDLISFIDREQDTLVRDSSLAFSGTLRHFVCPLNAWKEGEYEGVLRVNSIELQENSQIRTADLEGEWRGKAAQWKILAKGESVGPNGEKGEWEVRTESRERGLQRVLAKFSHFPTAIVNLFADNSYATLLFGNEVTGSLQGSKEREHSMRLIGRLSSDKAKLDLDITKSTEKIRVRNSAFSGFIEPPLLQALYQHIAHNQRHQWTEGSHATITVRDAVWPPGKTQKADLALQLSGGELGPFHLRKLELLANGDLQEEPITWALTIQTQEDSSLKASGVFSPEFTGKAELRSFNPTPFLPDTPRFHWLLDQPYTGEIALHLKPVSSRFSLNLTSPQTHATLSLVGGDEGWSLTDPAQFETTVTLPLQERISRLVIGQVRITPTIDARMRLLFSPNHFLLPYDLQDFARWRMDGALELGIVEISPNPLDLLLPNLTKERDTDPKTLRMTPIFFTLDHQTLFVKRFDMLLATKYPLTLWGKVDLRDFHLAMTLGLPSQALIALGQPELAAQQEMLQIPLEGKLSSLRLGGLSQLRTLLSSYLKVKRSPSSRLVAQILDVMNRTSRTESPKPTVDVPWLREEKVEQN